MQCKTILISGLPLIFLLATSAAQANTEYSCPPTGYSKADLLEVRANEFGIEDEARRNSLAIALTACLADPDPLIRDGVVYEGYASWMRAELLSRETLQTILGISLEKLSGEGDPQGFEKPFTVLAMSEVARTDRVNPWMTEQQRQNIIAAAANYLEAVDDYRGFSETEGWRHGVAHASDLVLQLVLNDAVDAQAIQNLMDATASQVAPRGTHFYIYGEPGRLARAVFYAYQRDVVSEVYWAKWFEQLASPAPLENWGAAFSSQAGLAQRHNTLEFLMALHLNAVFGENETLAALVMSTITAVLGG